MLPQARLSACERQLRCYLINAIGFESKEGPVLAQCCRAPASHIAMFFCRQEVDRGIAIRRSSSQQAHARLQEMFAWQRPEAPCMVVF